MAQLYGLGRKEFQFLMDLLFTTPGHREAHTLMRNAISECLDK